MINRLYHIFEPMKLHELFEDEERSILSVMGKQPDHCPGDFYCGGNNLTSLEGAPSSVGGEFSCSRNNLTSLEGAPSSVSGNFYCYDNNLTSLKGAPSSVGGEFSCSRNNLTSLEGAPSSVGGDFHCSDNKLTSLEGAPSSVGGKFYCYDNKLTSLHNIHKQIKHVGRIADFIGNPITSHVLGLLMIDGLKEVNLDNKEVEKIIDRHLSGDRDVFACQEELIEAGFEDFAQL